MREILFRGKTLTGRWVDGSYYKQKEFYGSKEDADVIITSKESLTYDQALDYEIVLPKTVGQYTGLTYKNGKKIFEGDVLKYIDEDGEPHYISVIFEDCAFLIDDNGVIDSDLLMSYGFLEIEVVGNIHDNPELLKGCE